VLTLCRSLADSRGEVYLSSRDLGKLLGVSHVSAWKLLKRLVADGQLVFVRSGRYAGRQANVYRIQ
jgi:biotin operon repressor